MFKKKEIVYTVYREKSFTKAAEKLFISQSSLSATIKKVENGLGYQIFDRSNLPIMLTDFGVEYIKYIEKIIELEKDFKNYTDDLDDMIKGSIIIGAPHLYASYMLIDAVTEFYKKYPNIKISVVEGGSSDLEKLLFDSKIDIMMDNKNLDCKHFNSSFYKAEYLFLVVPKSFSINLKLSEYQYSKEEIINSFHTHDDNPRLISIEEFRNESFLMMSKGNDTRIRSDSIFKKAKFEPKILMELDQLATLYIYASLGVSCAIVNDTVVRNLTDNNNLMYYKIDSSETKRNVCFYTKKNKYLSKAILSFIHEATTNL